MTSTRLRVEFLAACVFLMVVRSSFASDDPAVPLAKDILAKAGIRAGVCEMPRVGDGSLAAALARQGVAQVHALAPDAKAAEAARQPASAGGLLGSHVIIETGSPSALPLADWVADLYVVADATNENLPSLSAAEAGRVLSPYRGTAVVGNPAGTKAGLSRAALSEWAKTCHWNHDDPGGCHRAVGGSEDAAVGGRR